MKIFRIIKKSFKDAFRSIFRNFSLSVASISCTAITLLLVPIALIVTYNVNSITDNFENTLTIVAFVDGNATQEQIENLDYEIKAIGNVNKDETVFKSKDELKKEYEEDPKFKDLLSTLDANPLQSIFVVKVKNVKNISDTAKKIGALSDKGITKINYGETMIDNILSMVDIIRNVCVVAVVALVFVSIFLIGNTIKITIFSRRQEIGIMRLVGTSNIVIKMPFLIEGFVLGVIGAVIPVLLTIYGYQFVYDYFMTNFFTKLIILVKPADIVYQTSLVIVLVGGLVGMFGSTRAVKRYLKV